MNGFLSIQGLPDKNKNEFLLKSETNYMFECILFVSNAASFFQNRHRTKIILMYERIHIYMNTDISNVR